MEEKISPLAGKPAPPEILIDVPKLIAAYYTNIPDPTIPKQRVSFGTSGHRGTALETTFNEWHIIAISQAICLFRTQKKITGPLFLGIDTHALSIPAFASALEVLAANGVELMIAEQDEYTPTPVISHAILAYNLNRSTGLADGIVITPSHNPPHDGGFKYNPPTGGPANSEITDWIEKKANEFLENNLKGVKRILFEKALHAPTTHRHDFLNAYVNDLGNVIDMDIIRNSNIHLGVDPLGGAGVHYWAPIAEHYKLNLTIVNKVIDPTFKFMTVDGDGQIRMDPSSPYAMTRLIQLKDHFDIAFACDTDHDRHGIVTRQSGLLPPNHYLAIAIFYLYQHRPQWNPSKSIGKTVVTSNMLDRIAKKLGRALYEVPVGFKWFVEGLQNGSLGFCGEESAGASFSRLDGSVWTSDKDGMVPALLSAEITARIGKDLAEIYHDLENEFGKIIYKRDSAKANAKQKEILKNLAAHEIKQTNLAGEKIETILSHAPGNGAAIGGLKMITKKGWCVIRPSGTEEIYKIYAESFSNEDHANQIMKEAQMIVNTTLNSTAESKDISQISCDVGMIGLGVMGQNLLLNMADHGFKVTGYDKDKVKVENLLKISNNNNSIHAKSSLIEFISALKKPRIVMLLVPAGAAVDAVINELLPHLQAGDLIIDAGNSHFTDTDKRSQYLKTHNIQFLGVGISGGEEGARHGPSIMPGGSETAYELVRHLFEAISAKVEASPCVSYLGSKSSGHYVKMVHNGIEYGIMQLIAETYDFMKRGLGLNNNQLHDVYKNWNDKKTNGYLIDITSHIFEKMDGDQSLIDQILAVAKQNGTGMWTSQSAMDLQVPTPTIDTAVSMRNLSVFIKQREAACHLYQQPLKTLTKEHQTFLKQLHDALYTAMIITYAQGMSLLKSASEKYDYHLNLETVAQIWRGGCIIRSELLNDISAAFHLKPDLPNLLLDPNLSQKIITNQESLRQVISQASLLGIPTPAFMASLSYLDAYRSSWLPANLIQAQRDYFGSHTYERIDKKGTFHTQWEKREIK